MPRKRTAEQIAKPPSYKAGDRYGALMLTGKSYLKLYSGRMRRFVECICVCGKIEFKNFESMKQGLLKSCGCEDKGSTTHGLSYHPLYISWTAMKSRCYNENGIQFGDYGGRGIIVCELWKNSFKDFYDWAIANGWKKGLTVDRFPDINGSYEPNNCRIATRAQQDRNKRNSHLVTAFGETKNFSDWVLDSRCMVSHGELFRRLKIMTPEQAILTQPKSSNQWQAY